MIDQLNELITDQAILAILPIVTLGVIMAGVGFFLIWKERREGQEHHPTHKN